MRPSRRAAAPSLFDLETELRKFLWLLDDKQLVSRGCLDEVESHLRDEIDDLMSAGHSQETAFARACQTFGPPEELIAEYSKLYGSSKYAKLKNTASHYFDRRVVMRMLMGTAMGLGMMVLGAILGGVHFNQLLMPDAFLMVFGLAIGLTWLGTPALRVLEAYSDAVQGKGADLDVFRRVGRSFLNAGLLASFAGLLTSAFSFQDPSQLGVGIATSFIALVYGFLGYLTLGLGFEALLLKRVTATDVRSPVRWIAPLFLAIAATLFGWLSDGIPLRALTNLPGVLVISAGVVFVTGFSRELHRGHLPYLANGALASGILGVIFQLVYTMSNLSDPTQLGLGVSGALLCSWYAIFLAIALRSMYPDETLAPERTPSPVAAHAGLALALLAADFWLVILANSTH